MSKQVKSMPSASYCVQVYDAAKAEGESSIAIIALLKSGAVDWNDPASVAPVYDAFRQGVIAGILGVPREEAIRILALKGYVNGAKDAGARRDKTQHDAYRAAITRWSYAARQAGMFARDSGGNVTGATRAPRAPATPATTVGPTALGTVIVPKATSFDDVKQFARTMAALMFKFENANAKVSFGEYRPLFDNFRSAVTALGKAEAKLNETATKTA